MEARMAIKYLRTDSGRRAAGFPDERNDCVVRAIAGGLDVPYAEAHALCKDEFSRRDKCGTRNFEFFKWMNSITKNIINDVVHGKCKSITVEKFVAENPKGTFICRYSGHAFAVRDGVMLDTTTPRGGRRITHVWQVA
jgi:hypothetical protein